MTDNYLNERRGFWPWKKKLPKPKPVTEDIDATTERIYMLYCNALFGFGDKILDYVQKAERWPDKNEAYQRIYIDGDSDLYKKYKNVYDSLYKKALFNLIKILPEIKEEWKTYLKQYKELPPGDQRTYKQRGMRYIKHMKVDNRKLAIGMIGFEGMIDDTGSDSIAPDYVYEDSQTYSYCVVDYG